MSRTITAFLFAFLSLTVPAAAQGVPVSPGQIVSFTLSGSTLVNGGRGYTIAVPAGAKRLEVRMILSNCEADADLFVRYNEDVADAGSGTLYDQIGQGPAGSTKIVVVTATSSNPLREGTYYIGMKLNSGGATTGTLSFSIDTQNNQREAALNNGVQTPFSLGCVTGATLFNDQAGPYSYRLVVPTGATSVQVALAVSTPGVRVDIYANFTTDVSGTNNNVQASFRSEGTSLTKILTIPSPVAGTYFVALRLFETDSAVTGTLTATIGAAAGIGISSGSLNFSATVGSNPADQSFTVRNSGTGTLNFQVVKAQSWLSVSPSSGSATSAGVVVNVSVNTTSLSAGTYSDDIRITDQATPPAPTQTVHVTLTLITGPSISVIPSLDFGTVALGQFKDLTLAISNSGTSTLTVSSISSSNGQFSLVSPSTPFDIGAGASQSVAIRFQASVVGVQTGNLTISGNAQSRIVAVTGTGQSQSSPTITPSTTSLTFSTGAGTNPADQTFTVRNGGSGTLNYQIATTQTWITVTPTTGSSTTASNTHTAKVNVSGLAAGSYSAEIRISPTTGATLLPDNPFQPAVVVIAVQLTITGGQGGPTPTISTGGIVNAASFVSASLPGGSIARGSIFTIFGTNLGPVTLAVASAFPLQTALAGASVKVTSGSTSVDAIPLAAIATQINAIMPSNAPLGNVTITVTFNGRTSAGAALKVVDASLGVFTVNQSGMGPGIVQNFNSATDQPLNSRTVSARPSQFATLYGTGLGPISGPDNVAPGVVQLPTTVDIFVGGKQVTNKTYSGRAPQFAGLDQIVFQIPADAPAGCFVPVLVRAGGVTGNVITIAINANGGTCSDPANPLGTISSRGGKTGVIGLVRAGIHALVSGFPLELTADVGTASFTDTPASDFNFNPLTALPPLGACTVFTANNINLNGLLSGQLPNVSSPNVRNLDAGTPLTLTGAAGTRTLPKDPTSGAYFALIGSSAPIPGQPSQPLFLNPGAVTITGPGGVDVGRFTANINLPAGATWTNRTSITTVDRSQGVTLTWTGGDSATQVATIIGASVDGVTNAAGIFVCFSLLGPGSFTVPAPILAPLPPVNPQQPDQSIGVLIFGAGPLGSVPTFTASGLDAGAVVFTALDASTPTYR